jgi:hypothetical protein
MANQHIPNDPYDPYRSGLSDDNFGRRSRFETDMQPDPMLDESPPSSGKIALFALGVALVLGAVFYGLNNTSVHEAQTAPPKSVAESQPAAPQAPPGMRDVTPKANTQPGTTTGAAPSNPTPQQSSPQGTDRQ